MVHIFSELLCLTLCSLLGEVRMSQRASEGSAQGWYPGKFLRGSRSSLSPSSGGMKPSERDESDEEEYEPEKDIKLTPLTESTAPVESVYQQVDSEVESEAFHHHFKPEWRGVIKKQGHRIKNWKHRFFIISSCMMVYYDSEADYLSPERYLKPLGYHIITSISPTDKGAIKSHRGSLNASVSPNILSKNQEYIVETLENKTFYLKFSLSSGFLIAAQRAIGVYLTEFQDINDSQLKLAIFLCHIGFIDLSIQILYNLAYKTNPNADNLYHLGTAYLVNNNFSDAIIVLQECLDMQHDHIQALINLATAFYCTNNVDDAQSLFESVLSLEPSNIEAANNLTLLYSQNGAKSDFELAEFKIKYAITCRKDEPRLYLTYAEILISVDDIERAIDILFQGLKEVPHQESSDLNMKIGELFFLKNTDKTDSIEYYQTALGINPRNFRARQLLQEALMVRENAVSAQEDIFQAKEKSRNGGSAHSTLISTILKNAGDTVPSKTDKDNVSSLDDPILQGMLEKKSLSDKWESLYFELSRDTLQWFLSGSEFTKAKVDVDDNAVTHIQLSEVESISKVGGQPLEFKIDMRTGTSYQMKSKTECETDTWLEALQVQRAAINSRGDVTPSS